MCKQGMNDGEVKTVREAVSEYTYAISELSPRTQGIYIDVLSRFTAWCEGQQLDIGMIRPKHVALYLEKLRSEPSKATRKPLSLSTLHIHMRSIRTFLYWCAKPLQGYVCSEVPQELAMPRLKRTVIKPFSQEQIQRLQMVVAQNHYPHIVARDQAILAVLLDTGIRSSELCALTLDHVHITTESSYLLVEGKGLKEREVPLGKVARRLLLTYIQQYRPKDAVTKHVFLTFFREPMSKNALGLLFQRWKLLAKLRGVRCCPHDCRHTFALNYLMQGGDVYVLSRLMGHESVIATEMYLNAVEAIQARTQSESVLDQLLGEEAEADDNPIEDDIRKGRRWEATQEEYTQWTTFFSTWHDRLGQTWVCTSNVLGTLVDVLPDALRQDEQKVSHKLKLRLGTALRRRSGLSYGRGKMAVLSQPGPRGMIQWQVYQVPPAR